MHGMENTKNVKRILASCQQSLKLITEIQKVSSKIVTLF
jgi:hypothetical protein